MSVAETNDVTQALQNVTMLKSEERRESLTILGLSVPAVLAILIVVFFANFLAIIAFIL